MMYFVGTLVFQRNIHFCYENLFLGKKNIALTETVFADYKTIIYYIIVGAKACVGGVHATDTCH